MEPIWIPPKKPIKQFTVSDSILKDTYLNTNDKLVYITLLSIMQPSGLCAVTELNIAALSGILVETVSESIDILLEEGWIWCEHPEQIINEAGIEEIGLRHTFYISEVLYG